MGLVELATFRSRSQVRLVNMVDSSEVWRSLRVGDRVRLVEYPPEFLEAGFTIHRETVRVYKRILKRRRSLRVFQIDEFGHPWVECRFRRADGTIEYHKLAFNHGGIVRVATRSGA